MQSFILEMPSTSSARSWRYLPPIKPVHEAMSRHLILQAADAARLRALVNGPHHDRTGQRALVIGAGRCRDIPVRQLLERFERVTLTDIDADSVRRGLAEAGLSAEQARRVEVSIEDVVGVSDAMARGTDACFAEGVWTLASCEHLVERMASFIEQLEPVRSTPEQPYDLVVASCVISQLHLASAKRVAKEFFRRFPEAIKLDRQPRWRQAVCTLAARMQRCFIDVVHDLTADTGRIYLSATPRVHPIYRAPHGKWKTRETHDMLAHATLREFLDDRFVVEAQSQWQWSQPMPANSEKPGDLFDVEAMVLRKAGR